MSALLPGARGAAPRPTRSISSLRALRPLRPPSLSLGIYDPDAVPDVLIYADTIRSPEMRHEVPIGIPDPFLYVERDGRAARRPHLVRDRPRPRDPGRAEPHAVRGVRLRRPDRAGAAARGGATSRSRSTPCEALGVDGGGWCRATFPVEFADRLRAEGVDARPRSYDLFQDRRRVKSEAELAGIRRAQRAAEAGMDAARDLLRRAEPERRRARRRRRAAHVRADQGGDRRGLHRARHDRRRVHRLARRRRARSGTTWGPGRSPRASRS